MKRLCVIVLLLMMVLTLLPLGTASALPVLATPVPEKQTAPSMLSVMSIEPESSSTLANGGIRYLYKYINYGKYQDFGRALATLGYWLASGELTNGADYNITVSDGTSTFSIVYNLITEKMTVDYPPNAIPNQEADTMLLPAETESILPAAIVAPSLQGTTAKNPYSYSVTENGGSLYEFRDVDYALYELLSSALAEAGFALVSSELNADDGAYHIVVSDGSISLTVIYNMETKNMNIEYPKNVIPKRAVKYTSYTELKDGDTFPIRDGITATVVGWQRVQQWTECYYNSMYLMSNRSDTYNSSDEYQYIILTLAIDNASLADVYIVDMLNSFSTAWINDDASDTPYTTAGASNGSASYIDTKSASHNGDVIKAGDSGYYGVAMKLTAAQNESGKTLAVMFTIPNQAIRYAYFVDLANEKIAE